MIISVFFFLRADQAVQLFYPRLLVVTLLEDGFGSRVDSTNDRKPGCFVRNADFAEVSNGLGSRRPYATNYAGPLSEVFDKCLIFL
jgi:hypothetical protein